MRTAIPSSAIPSAPSEGSAAITENSSPTSPWWRSATIYQVWPRSFCDGDGDGIGDLAGIARRLDHLSDLGVDALWLCPVYRSPHDDAGYDISDYRRIDPLFGTLDDFDDLVAAVHGRGMRLIMDLVVNHTSDEHEWFVDSRSSPDSPRRDWYWWRPPRPGMAPGDPGAEPNNWASNFGGPAWELDEPSGEYYLHLFSSKQPDLNWENPEVREAVYEMMRWWVDRGIDGFRMDVVNFLSKVDGLPDGHVPEGESHGNGMEHFADGPRIHEFLAEMRREVASDRSDLVWIGEMPGVGLEHAARYTDPANQEVDMVFQFDHVGVDHGPGGRFDVRPLRLTDLKATLGRWQAGLADTGWNSLYWNNHDQPRVVSRFGDDGRYRIRSAKALATVLHLHRGTPFIYQGEELGMANYPFTSVDEVHDIQSQNHVAAARAAGRADEEILADLRAGSRDNARTPMQWDDSPAAGFTTGRPWMPVNPDHVQVNVAAQRDDPDSVLSHYRRLIELRHRMPVIVDGDFRMLFAHHQQVYAFGRSSPEGDERLLVLANLSETVARVSMPEPERWRDAELLLSNVGGAGSEGEVVPDVEVVLEPWEARVLYRPPANR